MYRSLASLFGIRKYKVRIANRNLVSKYGDWWERITGRSLRFPGGISLAPEIQRFRRMFTLWFICKAKIIEWNGQLKGRAFSAPALNLPKYGQPIYKARLMSRRCPRRFSSKTASTLGPILIFFQSVSSRKWGKVERESLSPGKGDRAVALAFGGLILMNS